MAVKLSVAVRNARLDVFESTIGATAKLRILTGTPPNACADPQTGTLLCEITLPSDWMTAASNGTKSKSGTWSGTGASNGTAGYFRIVDNTGATCHMQGTCSAVGGGADMLLDNVSIASSQAVVVNTFDIADSNS